MSIKSFSIILVFVLCALSGGSSVQWQRRGDPVQRRLTILMYDYVKAGDARHSNNQYMKFMYEQSPHYELGYIYHEIIERFRKLVELVKRVSLYHDRAETSLLRVQQIQKLYLEVYHLTDMMHEVTSKYRSRPEHQYGGDIQKNTAFIQNDFLMKKMEDLIDQEKKKRYDRLQQVKKERKAKQRDILQSGAVRYLTTRPPRVKSGVFPIDYGWDERPGPVLG